MAISSSSRRRGFYRSTIEIQAGQPSILIEDDTDTDLRYTLDIYRGLEPDQARYRGHHSTSIENGREPDGRQYRQWHERPAMDAVRDLQYRTPAPSGYNSDPPNIRRMAVWDPWVYDSGWYWQFYNTKAAPHANLLGIFAGPASHAIGAAHNGAGIFTAPGPVAGIAFEAHRRSPDARVYPARPHRLGHLHRLQRRRPRRPIQSAEHRPPDEPARRHQPEQGVSLPNRFPRSARRLPAPVHASRRSRRRDRPRSLRSRCITTASTTPSPPPGRCWTCGATLPVPKLHELAATIAATAHDLLDALVNGDGIYDFHFHYWHGGLEMTRQAVWINAVLTSDRPPPRTAPASKPPPRYLPPSSGIPTSSPCSTATA